MLFSSQALWPSIAHMLKTSSLGPQKIWGLVSNNEDFFRDRHSRPIFFLVNHHDLYIRRKESDHRSNNLKPPIV